MHSCVPRGLKARETRRGSLSSPCAHLLIGAAAEMADICFPCFRGGLGWIWSKKTGLVGFTMRFRDECTLQIFSRTSFKDIMADLELSVGGT